MNNQLKMAIILLMLHASTHSTILEKAPTVKEVSPAIVEQPKLNAQAESLFHIHQLATQAHETALNEYKKITPDQKKLLTIDFDLAPGESLSMLKSKNQATAETYDSITSDLISIGKELVKTDPENFKLIGNQLYRKVVTDSSRTDQWIPCKDYKSVMPAADTFKEVEKHPTVVEQPILNPRSQYLFQLHELATQTHQKALDQYNTLTPDQQRGFKFDWNSPLFFKASHPAVEAYGDASDNLIKTRNDLVKTDPENFKLIDDQVYRKVVTDSSGKYTWVPFQDYTSTITNAEKFKTTVKKQKDDEEKATKDALALKEIIKRGDPKEIFPGYDPASQQALELMRSLHSDVMDQYNLFKLAYQHNLIR